MGLGNDGGLGVVMKFSLFSLFSWGFHVITIEGLRRHFHLTARAILGVPVDSCRTRFALGQQCCLDLSNATDCCKHCAERTVT